MRGWHPLRPRTCRPGFSLLELVMVMATIGFIAAIAVPRMSSAADHSRDAAVKESTRTLQFAIELYAAEHFDRSPTDNADGTTESSGAVVISRLMQRTDDAGNVVAGGTYGPYIKAWPANPYSGLATLRIAASGSPQGSHGWLLDLSSRAISSDYVPVTSGGQEIGGGTAVDTIGVPTGQPTVNLAPTDPVATEGGR